MLLYADDRARAARQALGDATAVVWTLLWLWVAVRVHRLVQRLGAPGRELEDGTAARLRGRSGRTLEDLLGKEEA